MLKRFSFAISVLAGAFFLAFHPGCAQAAPVTIAAFEMSGLLGTEATFNATTNDANLQTVTISRGGGLNTSALANAFSSTAYVVGGTKANAIGNGEYLQFQLESKNNFKLSLSAINLNLRRSGTGPNAYQWQYSLDNFATAGVDVGPQGAYVGTENAGLAMPAIDLSAIPALQNLASGQRVTFRLFAWGATGAAGTLAVGRLAGDDLVVTGTLVPNKLAAFDLNGETGDQATSAATALDPDVKDSFLTRGGGLLPAFLSNAYSSKNYEVNGTKADALANADYVQFKLEAEAYHVMQLDDLIFNIRRSPGTGPVSYQWQYSLDDFASPGVDIGAEGAYSGTDDDGVAMPTIDLSGIPALQTAKRVTFRIYAWGATSANGTFSFGRLAGDDLSVTGITLPNKIIAFDPQGQNGDQVTFVATKVDTNLQSSSLSRGLGLLPSFLTDAFSSNDYTVGGNKADSLTNGDYIQFTVQAKPGRHFSLGTLDANFRRSGTGPNAYQWQYSFDNFATAGVDVGAQGAYAGTENNGLNMPSVDLSGIPGLQNVANGQTLTFRLYAWGATGAPGTVAIGRLAGDDLVLLGDAELNRYALSYSAGAGGSVSGSSTQAVYYGYDGSAVTAVPNAGYHFTGWSDGLLNAARTDLAVTGNVSVTANFAINTYTLTYAAGANGSLTGATNQTVNHGSDGALVTAFPNPEYEFVDWSDGSTDRIRTDLNVTGDINVTANFSYVPPEQKGGPGAFVPPPGVGSGTKDIAIDMDNARDIGALDEKGVNVLAHIRSRADFKYRMSSTAADGKAWLKVVDVDLFRNIVTLQIADLQTTRLSLGESRKIDLDGDGAADISIQFSGVYINRVELTMKSVGASASATVVSPAQTVLPAKVTMFTRDLKSGVIGQDVKALQIFLNTHGYALADSGPGSPGNETDKFGALTRIALAKFQKEKNITPASGYFGRITRNKINSVLAK